MRVVYKFILLVLADIILQLDFSSSQICGFPKKPVRLRSRVSESLAVGEEIVSFRVSNLKPFEPLPYITVPCHNNQEVYPNFVRVDTSDRLSLSLQTPLNNLIDDHKIQECQVNIILNCTCGRDKHISIILPLGDDNSNSPKFEISSHELEVQRPWNVAIPINYANAIIVTDKDRDMENAAIGCRVNHENIYAMIYPSTASAESLYKYSIYLYFKTNNINVTHEEFTIDVWNLENVTMLESATIILKTLPLDLYRPEFSQSCYNASISFGKPTKSAKLTQLAISAVDPDGIANILYEFEHNGEDDYPELEFMEIDRMNGIVKVSKQPSDEYVTSLENYIGIYYVRAFQEDAHHRFSVVPIVMYFRNYDYSLPGYTESSPITVSTTPEIEPYHTTTTQFETTTTFPYDTTTHTMTSDMTLDTSSPSHTTTADISVTTTSFSTTWNTSPGTDSSTASEVNTQKTTTATSEFECEAAGDWPDPTYCNIYHSCQPTAPSKSPRGFIRYRRCCQKASQFLIFCKNLNKCVYPDEPGACICAANPPIFDESCLDITGYEFTCSTPGEFPDPMFCDVYHTCEPSFYFGLLDFRKCCRKNDHYCELVGRCVNPNSIEAIALGCQCSTIWRGGCDSPETVA